MCPDKTVTHVPGLDPSLAAARDALLPKLISGELRVQDAERFACSALKSIAKSHP
jgi:hypothetical protein